MTTHTSEKDGIRLNIMNDDTPQNPRIDFDNLGTMICFHNNYNLGDGNHGYDNRDYDSWKEFKEAIIENEGEDVIILPLFLYDHSGITISTTSFSCNWDSGQIGFIFANKEESLKELGIDNKYTDEDFKNFLVGEVETYNQYLTGEVYGFEVIEITKCECCETIILETQLDSCWGFYGGLKTNGIKDHLNEEYHGLFDTLISNI